MDWTSSELLLPHADAISVRFVRAGVSFGAVKEVGPDGYTLAAPYIQLADPMMAAALPKLYAPNSSTPNPSKRNN